MHLPSSGTAHCSVQLQVRKQRLSDWNCWPATAQFCYGSHSSCLVSFSACAPQCRELGDVLKLPGLAGVVGTSVMLTLHSGSKRKWWANWRGSQCGLSWKALHRELSCALLAWNREESGLAYLMCGAGSVPSTTKQTLTNKTNTA